MGVPPWELAQQSAFWMHAGAQMILADNKAAEQQERSGR